MSLKNSISQAGGDGSSSTSESSLGSSSGYGSQNTVRLPEDNNQQQLNNSHQPTLTAVHDGMTKIFICSFLRDQSRLKNDVYSIVFLKGYREQLVDLFAIQISSSFYF